jgi:DNA polymerase III delta subunit
MIYSLFGSNDFVLNLELQKLVSDFKLKNYEIFKYDFQSLDDDSEIKDNDNQKLMDIKNNIDTQGLFSNNKTIIIRNLNDKTIPKKTLNPLLESLAKIEADKNVIVIFITLKTLTSLAKLKIKKQEFKEFSPNDLSTFIDDTAKENNVKLSPKAKTLLISFFGKNIGIIYNEIIKLSSYKPTISDTDILDLIKEPNLSNVFALTDAISQKNKSLAVKLLLQEYQAGTFDLLIFGTIISQIRNAILIKEFQTHHKPKLDIHPYVQVKLKSFVDSFDLKQLKLLYSKLFKYDLQIKKGKITAILALELFIVDCI